MITTNFMFHCNVICDNAVSGEKNFIQRSLFSSPSFSIASSIFICSLQRYKTRVGGSYGKASYWLLLKLIGNKIVTKFNRDWRVFYYRLFLYCFSSISNRFLNNNNFPILVSFLLFLNKHWLMSNAKRYLDESYYSDYYLIWK